MNNPYETELERRSSVMLKLLDSYEFRRETLPRPFIVEVTGIPDSGKSTILNRIDVFLRRQGKSDGECKILMPLEGTKMVRNIPRSEIQHTIAASNHTLQLLLEHSYSIDYDLILFDRGLYDAWCFIEWLRRKKRLGQKEADCFKQYFTYQGWLKNIDICFFIMCDQRAANRRNRKDAFLTKKFGFRTDPKTTSELHAVFMDGYSLFNELGCPVVLIDTTKLDIGQATRGVMISILTAFENRYG